MNFNLKTAIAPKEAANFIFLSILKQLKLNKHVLFFITGGSAISVGVKVVELLRNIPNQNLLRNLKVTLTDERYGEVGHKDSNWQQLLDKGFNLPQAKLIPVLTGNNREITVEKFNKNLEEEFKNSKETEYKIGLFGIGIDGHTAGILPNSPAIDSKDWAFGYDAPNFSRNFSRITITPKAIEKLDEAIVWVQGEDKWKVLQSLLKENTAIIKQPAQILKKVPLLTIFSDYKKI